MAGREKGKRKGERAQFPAPSLPRFLPFYFRVRAFSIQQARLSRSQDGTGYEKRGRGGRNLSSFLPLICIISLFSSPRVALKKKDDRPWCSLSCCRKIIARTCWVSSLTAFAWSVAERTRHLHTYRAFFYQGWENKAYTCAAIVSLLSGTI